MLADQEGMWEDYVTADTKGQTVTRSVDEKLMGMDVSG